MVVGAVIIVMSLVVAFVAGRRAARSVARRSRPGRRGGAGTRIMSAPVSARLLSVEEARDAVLALADPVGTEDIAAADALGRVVAETVKARVSLPPWPNSAMDGYAIVAADTAAASEETPVELRVIGDIAAGAAPQVHGRPGHGGPDRDRRPPPGRRRRGRPGRGHDAAGRGPARWPARTRRDRARSPSPVSCTSRSTAAAPSGRPAATSSPDRRCSSPGPPSRRPLSRWSPARAWTGSSSIDGRGSPSLPPATRCERRA